MSWLCSCALLAAGGLALGAAPRAQEPGAAPPATPAERARALVLRLGDGDARGSAFVALLQLGEPAATAAVEVLRDGDAEPGSARFDACLALLSELGPLAVDALEPLLEVADAAAGEARYRLLDCALDVAPFAGAVADAIVQRVRAPLQDLLTAAEGEAQQRYAEAWFRSVQLGVIDDTSVRAGQGVAELMEFGDEHGANYAFRIEAAATLLPYTADRTPQQTAAAIAWLTDRMLREPSRPTFTSNTGTVKVRYPCGPKDHRRFAAALVRLATEPTDAAPAHLYLLRHGLSHERWRALEWLRNAAALSDAQPALRELATDASTERTLRYEVVTTLGMLDRLAPASHDALQQLAGNDDEALAARARAALRGR